MIPQQHKDKAHDHIERGKAFLTEYFPEERLDQFIFRGKGGYMRVFLRGMRAYTAWVGDY